MHLCLRVRLRRLPLPRFALDELCKRLPHALHKDGERVHLVAIAIATVEGGDEVPEHAGGQGGLAYGHAVHEWVGRVKLKQEDAPVVGGVD